MQENLSRLGETTRSFVAARCQMRNAPLCYHTQASLARVERVDLGSIPIHLSDQAMIFHDILCYSSKLGIMGGDNPMAYGIERELGTIIEVKFF